MKITATPGEPTCWRNHFDECPVIKIDGEIATHVNEADDVAGYIIVSCYENGRLQLDGERIMTRRIEGRVEILGTPAPLD